MNLPDLDTLWDYNQPAATEQKFRALLPQARANPLYELELLTQIARAQGLQGHFAEAHQTLDQVEARLTLGSAVARVRYWLERGRVFNSSGQRDQAWPLFEQAWTLAQQIGEQGYAVDAGHMLGILESPALTWNERALQLAVNSRDPRARRWLGSLYNNIGWTYHDRGEYEQALDAFQKALRACEEQGRPDLIRIARWTVGRGLRSLNRLDEALAIQRQLEGAGDGYVEEEIAECLLALGQPDEAKPYFARAYERLSQDDYLVKHESARLERLRSLGV